VVFLKMTEDTTMGENSVRRPLPREKEFEFVKEAVIGKAPVSEVCKKYRISTRLYYRWLWNKKDNQKTYPVVQTSCSGRGLPGGAGKENGQKQEV
jgi:transposase-like protein